MIKIFKIVNNKNRLLNTFKNEMQFMNDSDT